MLILIVSAFFVSGCQSDTSVNAGRKAAKTEDTQSNSQYTKLMGKTMGTTYHITYESHADVNQESIDQLLVDINQSVSTYIPTSEISQFNDNNGALVLMTIAGDSTPHVGSNTVHQISVKGKINPSYVFNHLETNLLASQGIHSQSGGLFDPTIMPLVNYWGFGYQGHDAVDAVDTDSIKLLNQAVGLDGVTIERAGNTVRVNKSNPRTQLDFSAIAKGYAVDLVLDYLHSTGVDNALVEIGGETATLGVNPSGRPWAIGINTPDPAARLNDFEVIVELSDVALASSGNYRNFRLVDGKRYGHQISPITGYPIQTDVLSASVIASDCMMADGYATACMVMGLQKSLKMVAALDGVEVLLITDKDGSDYKLHYSEGFSKYLRN